MTKLRDALQNMRDFDIPCGPLSAPQPDEVVSIRWTSDDKNFNVGSVGVHMRGREVLLALQYLY